MTDEIQPFRIEVPDEQLEDLRLRLRHTRWPERETVADTDDPWAQGLPLEVAHELWRHWLEDYDWRATEARLNALPQYRTVLDGLAVHFVHVRSPHQDAMPLVMTHGWPGSIIELLGVVAPLTDPTAHGGRAEDAFHLVLPSLPGYGFSDKPTHPGWGVPRIASAWETLMRRLGYERFAAQGGDWGSMVTDALGTTHAAHVQGVHMNMPIVMPDPATMDDLTDAEAAALASFEHYQSQGNGYSSQQATRPQTLGYGLADSPVGQMAWIVEKFWEWSDHGGDLFSAFSAGQLLDNVMLYWLTDSGASSARLYWESFRHLNLDTIEVPVACSIFPKEIFRTSRRWAEQRFTDLRHFGELDRGGHFAAFEQPELLVSELRAGFATMR